MQFKQALEFGKTGESVIANFMKSRGLNVLPVYEKTDNEYKGPALYCSDGKSLTAPDMLCFGNKVLWVEAKHKNAFSWHRNSQRWVTGIDAHHFAQYLKVRDVSGWPVWLMFLHREGTAIDTPDGMVSPSGLFGNDITFLENNVNHTHQNWGRHGMVYWAHDKLKSFGCNLAQSA
jgi:hypothetical protein